MRHILAARHKLARGADICVLPQLHRLELFKVQTGRVGSTFCVWNCPRKDEVGTPKAAPAGPLNFYYHGNVSPPRLPLTVIQALARASTQARLTIVGYETVGSQGYAQKLLAVSEQLGLGDRVRYRGAMQRQSCLAMASEADVGLSLMPMSDTDPNLSSMVGASNKAFDYLARGMALLVSDLPDWRDAYVNAGMALACDPSDVESLCSAIVWCEHNRDKLRLMGERGSEKIIEQWNYESQFAPVTAQLETA
jgi:glycosyltransferase involved in cell wall biosynthesis